MQIFNEQLDEGKALPVKGSLLMKIIRALRAGRLTAGWGLKSVQSETGVTLSVDPSILPGAVIYARLGAASSSSSGELEHDWEEVRLDLGAGLWKSPANARTQKAWGKAVPQNLGKFAYQGMVCKLEFAVDGRTGRRYMLASPTPLLVPVACEYDSGSNGAFPTDPPTWTYTITDASGNILATGLTPENQRDLCEYYVATRGLAYLDDSVDGQTPTWKLAWCNEELNLPPGTTGDNLGYETASGTATGEAHGAPGGTVSVIAQGELAFTPGLPETLAEENTIFPVYTRVDPGARGVDPGCDVVQWVDLTDYVPDVVDTQGYESVTDGTTTLDKTDGGIIAFDTASPSAGELPVVFTVTDNDPTATVTAKVDVSGYVTTGGSGSNILDLEIRVNDDATTGDTLIDDDNYEGRILLHAIAYVDTATPADWTNTSYVPASTAAYIPSALSADRPLSPGILNDTYFYVSSADGKLYLHVNSADLTAGRIVYIRIIIIKGAVKTAADTGMTIPPP